MNKVIKTKDFHVACVIDYTSGSYCQRFSTHFKQNHSSVSFRKKIYLRILRSIDSFVESNLVKDFNKQLLIQPSQMRITIENINRAKQHPMLLGLFLNHIWNA